MGLGAAELLILGFLCLFFFVGLIFAILALASIVKQKRSAPAVWVNDSNRQPAFDSGSRPGEDRDSQLNLVARITRRFCPQCRAPIAADAPQGLCPACLLAGGIESAAAAPVVDGAAVTTPPSGSRPSLTGEIGDLQVHFPQLEILELLGRGGMGAVYKARQKQLDRIVALKVIPPEAADDPTFTERFNREARALARLNHPNIVTVHDFGQSGKVYYLVMEYIDGVNLRQTLQAERLSPAEALAIVPQICDALQYAHDQGVVHRDIKPENVLLDRSGRVKIADFGLAKLIGKGPDDFTLTRTQQVMGTPRYMAPEQFEKPTSVDHRADIYSLGVVIYEMLTGELPVGRFPLPSERVQIDVRIDQVVLRTLEKEPERRYQRASQLKTELASAAGTLPVYTQPVRDVVGIANRDTDIGAPPPKQTLDSQLQEPRSSSFFLAVGLPTLLLAAVFALLWLDVSFAQPAYDPEVRGPLSRSEEYFGHWKRGIAWVAALSIPLAFASLTAYWFYRPRLRLIFGERGLFPVSASRWIFAVIGLLGLLTLMLPWLQIKVLPNAMVVLDYRSVYPQVGASFDWGSTVVHEGSWRSFAAMPAGWRFAHRGATLEVGVLFAVIFAALLALGLLPHPTLSFWRNGLGIMCGLVGLALVVSVLHRAADRDPQLLVDQATLRGLERFARDSRGTQPTDIRRWLSPASQAFDATPGPGMVVAWFACGLAFLVGVSNLAGSVGTLRETFASPTPEVSRPKLAAETLAVRHKVQPPAIALMMVGGLGVLLVLAGGCLLATIVPVWTEATPRVHAHMLIPSLTRATVTLGQTAAEAPLQTNATYARVTVGGFAAVLVLFHLPISALILFAGWRMYRLQSYGLAVTAAAMAVFPCTLVWVLAMPIGLWALFVLARPEVREAFES